MRWILSGIDEYLRNKPADDHLDESVIECMNTEGIYIQNNIKGANDGEEFSYLELLNSTRVVIGCSLLIQNQIEKEVYFFCPKRSDKLRKRQKEHVEDMQKYIEESDMFLGETRSTILEAYNETNNAPWLPE